MADAIFKHGDPTMMDFTPDSDVAAGDVVVEGNAPFVAHLPILANETGAIATGGGSYEMTSSEAIDIGEFVYFANDTVNVSQDGVGFGVAETETANSNETLTVRHDPFVNWD